MCNRRVFMLMLLAGMVLPGAHVAFAKDGDSGGGSNSGSGSGNSGSGSSNSGSGGGDDDHDGKDDSRDNDKNDDRSDDSRIRSAVKSGNALPLRRILSSVRNQYKGKVVRIRLTGTGSRMTYRIRIIEPSNRLIEVRVNASNGRIIEPVGIY